MTTTTTTDIIKVGKYEFEITENINYYEGELYYKTYKIKGNVKDCIGIAVNYLYQQQKPSANFINLAYDEKCSKSVDLDKGDGSRIMVKAALKYVWEKNPLITSFEFQDSSEIDCSESLRFPLNYNKISLFYFSMAFNEQTWYEKYFGARLNTESKHDRYKQRLHNVLHTPELKPTYRFLQQKVMINPEIMNETTYNTFSTLGEVFQSIPKQQRCDNASNWIVGIMEILMKSYVKNSDWIIPMVTSTITYGGKRSHSHVTRRYYCPKNVRISGNNDKCIEKA